MEQFRPKRSSLPNAPQNHEPALGKADTALKRPETQTQKGPASPPKRTSGARGERAFGTLARSRRSG